MKILNLKRMTIPKAAVLVAALGAAFVAATADPQPTW